MLDSIRSFFDKRMAAPPAPETSETSETPERSAHGHDHVHVAACALLLELAHADDVFSDDERAHIEDVLGRHFALDAETAGELIELAERERTAAVDLYQFTSLITASYDEGQRMVLAEIMWRLVYADGELAKHEEYLMRKLSSLLELRPGYLAEARNRATRGGR